MLDDCALLSVRKLHDRLEDMVKSSKSNKKNKPTISFHMAIIVLYLTGNAL